MIRLVFPTLFVIFTLSSNAQDINKKMIEQDINNMSISNDYNFEILSISSIINNICIVTINPPYREFPNILIYNYDNNSKKWSRVFESFCIGIQPEPSSLTDLHTTGYGVDFSIGNDSVVILNQNIKNVIAEAINNNSIIIPYQNFLHMHSSPLIKSFYTIDKTSYSNYANILFQGLYNSYPKQECTMFDTPKIVNTKLSFDNDYFIIAGETENKQLWTIKFKGIDSENQYLLDKNIIVKKLN